MRDTSSEITRKISEMFQAKTPMERLKMGISMYDTSKYLVTCGIKQRNPGISDADLRRELFLIFYGNDFDPITREKIIQHLENYHSKNVQQVKQSQTCQDAT